jgi:hypothetical protein
MNNTISKTNPLTFEQVCQKKSDEQLEQLEEQMKNIHQRVLQNRNIHQRVLQNRNIRVSYCIDNLDIIFKILDNNNISL